MATFDEYVAARRVTDDKASVARTAVATLETAQAAVENAQETLATASDDKDRSFLAWQEAEQLENAIATELGIDPRASELEPES